MGVADGQQANVSCVHLEETDFSVLVVLCEQERSCVGAEYEDGCFLLSVSRCMSLQTPYLSSIAQIEALFF